MKCNDVATIMDEHTQARLSTTERCALDEHLASCESCSFAWHAQTALLAMPIPGAPPWLLGDALHAAIAQRGRAQASSNRGRARTVLSVAVLAAGATLAAAALVTVVQRTLESSSAAVPVSAPDGGSATSASTERGRASADTAVGAAVGAEPVDTVNIDVDTLPVVRTPPEYPPAALERSLEGWVQLSFTIAANGVVADVKVVDTNEPLFEGAAVRALSTWKYLPRVVAGKRVASHDVQTIIRFAMAPPPARNAEKTDRETPGQIPQPSEDARADARRTAYTGVERGIAIAWERISVQDLRGAELELDELRATYDLEAHQEASLWNFYAYIFTQYGDYGRAIAAYQSGIAIQEKLPGGAGGQRLALAKLYFARHQYDLALKTVLPNTQNAGKPRNPGVDAFIEQLRSLGVTEETL